MLAQCVEENDCLQNPIGKASNVCKNLKACLICLFYFNNY